MQKNEKRHSLPPCRSSLVGMYAAWAAYTYTTLKVESWISIGRDATAPSALYLHSQPGAGKGIWFGAQYAGNSGDDQLNFYQGNDEINMAYGDNTINLSGDNDAINFGPGNGVIKFDENTDDEALMSYNATSNDLTIQAKNGDVIIQLGD